ncbi:kinase-like domain-containing protein [Mycena crocata]|nr:kinase-like domain-containing protein [Mycena crocata]
MNSFGSGINVSSELFIKKTPPAPEHRSQKVRRLTDHGYKVEHEAHVRIGVHSRVVRYYGWDKRGFLFERHKAGDLLDHLLTQRDPPPPLSVRLQWASDIVEGMAFLHSKGVVWVDVSLSNVLLSDDCQRALLCDMGGACILPMAGQKPLPHDFMETTAGLHPMRGLPYYEHTNFWDGPGSGTGAGVSPHHDRFGYGILLFCLLTLHFPHSRRLIVDNLDEANAIAELHFEKNFATLDEEGPAYAELDDIIQRCFRAQYMSSDALDADVRAACAKVKKDPPPTQHRVQDPIADIPHYPSGTDLPAYGPESDGDYAVGESADDYDDEALEEDEENMEDSDNF